MIAAAASPNASNPLWYTTRGAGMVTLVLLTASVVLGIVTSVRWQGTEWPRFLIQSLHRSVSLFVLAFLTLHIVTAVLDPFAHLGVLDALVPFASAYRPLWLALGVIASELLVALTVTSLLRRHLSFAVWRAVHWLAYACWPVALVHGLGTGTDTRAGWAVFITAACATAVVVAIAWRLLSGFARRPAIRVLAGIASAATLVTIGVWLTRGPLQAGWARAAGTPSDLLAQTQPSPGPGPGGATAASPSPTPAPALAVGMRDPLSGTVVDRSDGSLQVSLVDQRDRALRMVVTAQVDGTASLAVTRSNSAVCNSPADVSSGVRATCGSVVVSLSLERGRGNQVVGEMTTAAAAG